MSAGVDKTNALLDEERRLASHQEVKASIDKAVNTRIKQESARVEPKEAGEVAEVARPKAAVGPRSGEYRTRIVSFVPDSERRLLTRQSWVRMC
jgi:hypothetical protein